MISDADARRAIAEDLDDTLVVEAAAGTGRRPSWSTASCACSRHGRATMIEIVAVTFTEKAAGELKLRLRERLEARRAPKPSTPWCGSGWTRRSRRSRKRTSTRSTASAPTCCASGRSRRASIRCSPSSPSRRRAACTNARSRAGCRTRSADPPEGVRRALRRTSAPSFGGGDADGPIDRLRNAGRALAEWRDFPAPWRRPPFDRDAEIDRLVADLHRLAELTARRRRAATTCSSIPTAVRRLSRQIRLEESFGQRDYDGVGGAARRPGSRSRVLAHAEGQRLQVRQGRHPHRGARRARRAVRRRCSSSGRRPTPTSPRCSSRSWPARRRAIRS